MIVQRDGVRLMWNIKNYIQDSELTNKLACYDTY